MNIVDTIRNALVPIHREGWPFIAAFARRDHPARPVLDDAVLDRPDPDGMVRLFLPRSRARHAGRRPPGGEPGRRRDLGGRVGGAAARARPRQRRDDARLGVHERLFLPCEPRAGARPHHQDRASRRQVPQCRARQGKQRERAQRPGDRQPQRPGRRRADRRAGGAPHRLLGRGRHQYRHRRAFRADPLRLARRRVHAEGGGAARRRRADGGGRRDHPGRIRRRAPARRSCGSPRPCSCVPATRQRRTAHPRDPDPHGAAQSDHRAGDLRRTFRHHGSPSSTASRPRS